MGLYGAAWSALHAQVGALADEDMERPSGCAGWLVRDLLCHLVIDAQDVLITLATPAATPPTRDAVGYWTVTDTPPTGDDPLDALTVRLAAAYGEPWLLTHHLADIGSAAARAAADADPDRRVSTRDEVYRAGDFLDAYVLEWTLHHLDLVVHLAHGTVPPVDSLARSRAMLEAAAARSFPAAMADVDVLRIGTGRRPPSAEERDLLGPLSAALPFVVG